MKSDVAMPVTNWLTLIEVLQRWLITSTIKLRAKSNATQDVRLKLSKKNWKELHELLEQIQSQTILLEEKSARRFGRRLIIVGRLIRQLGFKRSNPLAKNKKKKNKNKHEQAVVEAVASENATATTEAATTEEKPKKKKKYERSVRVRAAGEVAKFLVYNAKNFRGRYEGDTLYSFRVDMDDKSFLDDLLDRLEPDKK